MECLADKKTRGNKCENVGKNGKYLKIDSSEPKIA